MDSCQVGLTLNPTTTLMHTMTTTPDPEHVRRQYVLRSSLFMSGYVAINVAAIFGAFDDATPRGAVCLALTASAPLAGHIWAVLAYMRDSDEFVRGLMAKRFVVASGIAMALFSAWGFMEIYAGARHAPGSLIFPLFWAAYGAVCPFIRTSH
jgi:putative oxidoreductase